jgi:Tol biopolymer transport system component
MSTDVALGKTADTNDIFLRDRALGTTTWVSREASGGQANSGVHRGHLSADGSTVVFDSNATDLVAGMPTDGLRRIFVYDVATGTTTLLGTPDPAGSCEADEPKKPCNLVDSLSSDGRFVVFQSIATNVVPSPQPDGIKHVYLHDRALGTTEMIDVSGSQAANAASGAGAVSADGARVAFQSNATNLVVPDLNPLSDIFVRDRLLGTTSLVSVASDGSQPAGLKLHPSISPDGRHVAFSADGPGLVKGDTNALRDTFVRDLETGITERVSVSSQGLQGVLGDSLTVNTSLSEAGRFVAFPSLARTLVEGDTNLTRDVFVHDRATGITQRVSLRTDGSEASGLSHGPVALSADGQTAAFGSDDAFLIPGDTNRVGTPSSASRTRWIPRT